MTNSWLVQVSSGAYLVMGTVKYLYVAMCKGESLATKWILSSMNKFNSLANWVADMNWFINHQCILIYPLIIWFYDSEPFRITGKIVTLATVMSHDSCVLMGIPFWEIAEGHHSYKMVELATFSFFHFDFWFQKIEVPQQTLNDKVAKK